MSDKMREEIANYWADWARDAVAGATQDRSLLKGEPEYNSILAEAIELNAHKAITNALQQAAQAQQGETEPVNKVDDPVNHPSHYMTAPNMEAIDVIRAALTPTEYMGYLKGSILKYRLRAGRKGEAEQDIAKSDWYRERANELDGAKRIAEWAKEVEALPSPQHQPDWTPERERIAGAESFKAELLSAFKAFAHPHIEGVFAVWKDGRGVATRPEPPEDD